MLILKIFLLLAAVASFGALLTEVVIKTACGKQHGGKAIFYIFLGATVEHMNDDPWFVFHPSLYRRSVGLQMAEGQVPPKVLHLPRKSGHGSILSANTTSRMESSANGMTYFGSVVSFVLFIVLIFLTFLGRKVGHQLHYNSIQWFSGIEAGVGDLRIGFYLFTGIWPIVSCSWLLYNFLSSEVSFTLGTFNC